MIYHYYYYFYFYYFLSVLSLLLVLLLLLSLYCYYYYCCYYYLTDTFSKTGQAAPQLLFQHAVQRLQVAAMVRVEKIAALCSEHAPQAAALHPAERLACCQDALGPL